MGTSFYHDGKQYKNLYPNIKTEKQTLAQTVDTTVELHESFVEDIVSVEHLHKDMSYQRVCSSSRLARMKKYDVDIAGSIDVNQRPDGTLWVLDGGHRVELARKHGEKYMYAHIFNFQTVEQEALFFELKNRNMKPPTALQRLRALIVARDSAALDLQEILQDVGYVLDDGRTGAETGISCALTLQRLHTRSPEELHSVLHLIKQTWGYSHGAVAEHMVLAVSMFVRKYHGKYDFKRFKSKLSQYEPDVLANRAVQLSTLRKGLSTEKLLFEVLVDYYDQQLRNNRLRSKEENE